MSDAAEQCNTQMQHLPPNKPLSIAPSIRPELGDYFRDASAD